MSWRDMSLFYLRESFTGEYKSIILNYLKENELKFKYLGEPEIVVELHNFDRIENPNPNGHLYIFDREGKNPSKVEEVCRYVLSKDRKFIPLDVTCREKNDYILIENTLKENYGKKGRLTMGPLGLGGLFNQRGIKRK